MNTIVLKRATLKDFDGVAEIEKAAAAPTYCAVTEKKEITSFIKNDFVFFIKRKEIVIGLVAFGEISKKTAYCNGLVILPKFRGKGYARKAMTLAMKKMAKYPRIELVVHPHNTPAISLYLSLGFVIEAWKDDYYGNGEPRLVMKKKNVV